MPSASVEGVRLHYRDGGGTGVPVVLIHGAPLHSGMWAPQERALGARGRLVAPDLKGFGKSDAPSDRELYSMDSYADELYGLATTLSLVPFVGVGLSMGGYVLFALLRRHRDALRALVLADTRAEADAPDGIEKRTRQQERLAREGMRGLVEELPDTLLGDTTRATRPDIVADVKELMRDTSPAGFAGALEAIKRRPDSTPELASIDVPTLIVVGSEDRVTPPDSARAMHERIRRSDLVVVEGAGHFCSLEAPDAFNGALVKFLERLPTT